MKGTWPSNWIKSISWHGVIKRSYVTPFILILNFIEPGCHSSVQFIITRYKIKTSIYVSVIKFIKQCNFTNNGH